VRAAVDAGILIKGGGHAMAAGITLQRERLPEFRAFIEDTLRDDVARSRHVNEIVVDGAVSARGVNVELAKSLERAGPFGSGNPEAVLVLPAHELAYTEEVGGAHLRLRLKSDDGAMVNAMAFRAIGQKLGDALLRHRGQRLHVAGMLSVDRWQGSERVQLRVCDVAEPEPEPATIR
jgi:single-stranded-DNA-specific exonuclease